MLSFRVGDEDAAAPGGDRPVLVLTRDPVADRIGSIVVAALTRRRRGLVSELELTPTVTACRQTASSTSTTSTRCRGHFRRRVTALSAARMGQACRVLAAATGC